MKQSRSIISFLITIIAVLILGAQSAGAQSNLDDMRAQLDEPFTLRIGEWALLGDSSHRLAVQIDDLISDSRCPSDVDCVVSGQARFDVRLSLDGVVQDSLFTIGQYPIDEQDTIRYAGYVIEMVDVEPPAPKHDESLTLEDYQVTLVIHTDEALPTPVPTVAPTPTLLPTPISSDEDELSAVPGQSFDLRVEQTVNIADLDFSLTFRSASSDSGCLTDDDCSIMTFDGSLALRRGDESEMLSLSAGFDPETPFTHEFAGLEVQLLAVKKLSDDSHVASFVVIDPSAQDETDQPEGDRPTALLIDQCASFSRFDATAILQEDVESRAVANLILGPTTESIADLFGLCGYVSQATADTQASDTSAPHIVTALDSAHVVVATLPYDLMELLPIIEVVSLNEPQFDPDILDRLRTYIAAGNHAEIIPSLFEATQQSQLIKVESIEAIGDEGFWLWKKFEGGHFAVLFIRSEYDFAVVAALLGDQVHELNVRDYSIVIARSMLERRVDAPAPLPLYEPPSDDPNNNSPTECELITAAEAEAILGEAVHEQIIDDPDEGCGYVAASENSPSDDSFSMSDVWRGVMTQRLTGAAIEVLLPSMAETLGEGIEGKNDNAHMIFNAAILSGNIEQALLMLANIADGSKVWRVEELQEVDKTAVFMWGRLGGRRLAALVTIDDAGDLVVVVASLPNSRRRFDVRAAMVELAKSRAMQ